MSDFVVVNSITSFEKRHIFGASMDHPRPNTVWVSDALGLTGWVIGQSSAVDSVELIQGEVVMAQTPVSVYRPDVAAYYKRDDVTHCGFRFDAGLVTDQPMPTLSLRAVLRSGVRAIIGRLRFRPHDPNWPVISAEAMTPPAEQIFVGPGDFQAIGDWFLEEFIELGGLQPNALVLDVGCGIGRMTIPLTRYLAPQARYEGFDIVPSGILWCQTKITPHYPNFRFQVVDIYNKEYNPAGHHLSNTYHFPYPDQVFDFVILTSVFTHMLPNDLEHYLAEIARVTRLGGRVFATFFLLNDESERLIHQGASQIDFQYDHGVYRVQDSLTPEVAVAYREDYVRGIYRSNRLAIVEPIRYGPWSGHESRTLFQDIIVATKS